MPSASGSPMSRSTSATQARPPTGDAVRLRNRGNRGVALLLEEFLQQADNVVKIVD